MIALVDYGIGNLRSVEKALQYIGSRVLVTGTAEKILAAEKIVLPGVGAFGDGMAELHRLGLVHTLRTAAKMDIPILGICLGMQLLFESSAEMGTCAGLGLLAGRVIRFPDVGLKIPQTGWNQIWQKNNPLLLNGLQDGSYVYFNHSYFCQADEEGDILGWTDYGLRYASVVGRGRIFGVQFHPEKSQDVGLQIIRNFMEMV